MITKVLNYKDIALIFILFITVRILSFIFFGYVQDAVLDLSLDLKKTTVYACGSELMIRDALTLLVKNGLAPSRFYSDAFLSSK